MPVTPEVDFNGQHITQTCGPVRSGPTPQTSGPVRSARISVQLSADPSSWYFALWEPAELAAGQQPATQGSPAALGARIIRTRALFR